MRVALVHYHLQSGGVTRIIGHIQKALDRLGIASVVLTGKTPPQWPNDRFRVVPGLLYEVDRPLWSVDQLAREMRQQATDALGAPPDLWHVHNHSLGKNLLLPQALRQLAEDGEHLLFHIHDFAEDGRPANYRAMLSQMAGGHKKILSGQLYPCGEHLHYAVLNTRDWQLLQSAGLPGCQLHLLPNPVDMAWMRKNESLSVKKKPLWLYPTRAIRRKNLGEFLLWAAIAPEELHLATTSGPENPREWPRYHRWQQVANSLQLPVHLGMVETTEYTFIDLVRLAEVALTTSVSEGFGMAYLEPWALGTPVWGRNLADVTAAFHEDGLQLPACYNRLAFPLEWVGEKILHHAALQGLTRNLAAYGRMPKEGDVERVLCSWCQEGMVDFGRLDEPLQERVLTRVAQHRAQAALLVPSRFPDPALLAQVLEPNRQALAQRYSLEQYGGHLQRIYQQVVDAKVTPCEQLDGEVLLDRFLAPERLTLLQVD